MMDRFRDGLKGPLAWAFLVVIIVPFIFGGISSFLYSNERDVVATVDGKKIGRGEFEQLYQNMRARFGDNYAKIYDTEAKEKEFRGNVLDLLINQAALAQAYTSMDMRVSTSRIRKEIQSIPAFQENGKYSAALAERRISEAGYSKDRLQGQLEQDLLTRQLSGALTSSAFVLPNEIEQFYSVDQESRSGRFVRVPAKSFLTETVPEDAIVQAWYESHREQFAVPEKFVLQYLELKADDLQASINISEADISAYYEEHAADYQSAEKRQLAHILLTVDKSADKDAEAKVRKQAEDLLARAQHGENFGDLAKQYSQDPISKDQGGALDAVEKGVMEPAFDEAAFALTMQQPLSALVRTRFGFELIRLTGIEPGNTLPLATVHDEIAARLKADKASDLFAEKQQAMTDKGFEVSDSLEEAAKASGLNVQETSEFTRDLPAPVAQLTGVMDAVQSDEVLGERHNSSVISVGDNHALMLRIKNYTSANTKPLTEVRSIVLAALQEESARKAAIAFGASVLEKVRQGMDAGSELANKGLSWEGFEQITRSSPAPEPLVRAQLFNVAKPLGEKASLQGASLSNGDYLIVELKQVQSPDFATAEATKRTLYQERLSRYQGDADYRGMVNAQKSARKVERKEVASTKSE